MLQHQHALRARQRDRAAGPALAHDAGDHGGRQCKASLGAACDGFRLPAFFRLDAGKGARSVDQRHHGQAEAARHLHQADRLAITFRFAHAEIVLDPALGVVALFVPDQHDLAPVETRHPAHDRLVFAIKAIAAKRHEIVEHHVHVVAKVRARTVTGDLRFLPGRERGVSAGQQLRAFQLQPLDFVGQVYVLARSLAQLGDTAFEGGNGLFEFEVGGHALPLTAPAPARKRVAFVHQCDQPCGIDMRVDLGGGDISVAEQCLQNAQIRPAL